MKTVQIKLYTFKELGSDAKQKALTVYRHVNTDFDWWWVIYEDFVTICTTLGLTVDINAIKFKSHFTKEVGCAFSAKADLCKLPAAIAAKAWREYIPEAEMKLPELSVDRRVMALIANGKLPHHTQVIGRFKAYGVVTDLGIFIESGRNEHDNLFAELEKLDEWFRIVAEILNRFLYDALHKQYEFLTSETTIIESPIFHDYLFTGDGRSANHLLEIAKHHNVTK